MAVIGLTGGIASGKSTAAQHLESLGAHVIDADKLGHRAYEPDTQAFREVVAAFGEDVVGGDGEIDRKALGAKVFGQPAQLERLTAIVWPEIRRLAETEIRSVQAEDSARIIVLEAAVMFEAGWEDAVDEVWVVTVDRAVAIQRATARDGSDAGEVEKRIDSQMPNKDREARADVVIDNSGGEPELLRQIDAQWHRLTQSREAS